MVPSRGSITHRTPLVPGRDAPSSARMASSGRAARMPDTMSASDARSASLTMSFTDDLVSMPELG